MQRTEEVILKNLIYDEEYTRKVLPFLKSDYFAEKEDRLLFEQINKFINKYNNLPTKEALVIEFDNLNIKDEDFDGATNLLTKLEKNEERYYPYVKCLEYSLIAYIIYKLD